MIYVWYSLANFLNKSSVSDLSKSSANFTIYSLLYGELTISPRTQSLGLLEEASLKAFYIISKFFALSVVHLVCKRATFTRLVSMVCYYYYSFD
jgi:hypothetical protein